MVDGENRNTAKLLSLIGLARKAGKITIGTEMVCDAVRSGDVKLVIASENSSDNTKKRISNCVLHYVVRLEYIAATPDELGRQICPSGAAESAEETGNQERDPRSGTRTAAQKSRNERRRGEH